MARKTNEEALREYLEECNDINEERSVLVNWLMFDYKYEDWKDIMMALTVWRDYQEEKEEKKLAYYKEMVEKDESWKEFYEKYVEEKNDAERKSA